MIEPYAVEVKYKDEDAIPDVVSEAVAGIV